MTIEDLKKYDIFELQDLLVQTLNELRSMENTAENQAIIQEKKEHLLL